MKIVQLSVFIENTEGRLREVTGILKGAGVNIRALSLADSTDFGVLRIVVDKPQAALDALHKARFTVKQTPTLAVEVPDKPGGLHSLLDALGKEDINVEYVYAFVEKRTDNAIVIVRVEETDRAIEVLKEGGFHVLGDEDIDAL